ncbi:MAG TPA: TonB-dependent receptor [Caulobacteraceae bacterium]|nr:TonB-dependent receptor [Caulobacteraceae bacterium]
MTGSRVITNGNNSPTPVTVFSTQQMMELQPTIIADALNTLPSFTGSVTQTTNPGNSSQNNAAQQLNLRAVGTTRVLILFDGNRVQPTSPLGVVDVDMIPSLLLQRVDVVTGGASAVYGSDAISGVVNFITDTKFNGLKINLSDGISQYGDDQINDEAIAVGRSFMGGRLHFEASYEHHDDPGIFNKLSRPWGALDWTVQGGGTAANPYHLVTNTRLAQSSFSGVITSGSFLNLPANCNTAFVANCPYLEFNQNGVLSPFVHGAPTGGANIESGGDGGYYSSASLKSLLVSDQVFGRVDYDITDHVHGFFEFAGTMDHNENNHQWIEVRGTSGGSPGVLGYNNAFLQNVVFPAGYTNPYNAANTTSTFQFGKMLTQLGTFQPNTEETNYMMIGGLSGDFDAGKYKWNVGFQHSNSVQDTKNDDNLNQGHMLAAENAVVNPANGQIVCHAALVNPNYANCVPINLFGPTSESAAAIKYVTGVTEYWAHTHQDDINGSLSGAPISTWAGPVTMAVSGDARKLTYSLVSNAQPTDLVDCNGIQFNCFTANGTPQFQWASNTVANRSPVSQSVWEVAYETDVPLIRDVPFIQSFNINGAVRYTDYSNSGGVDTWKIGAEWHVNDQLTIRATRSRDIRAPNLNELYAPTVFNPAGYTDYNVYSSSCVNIPVGTCNTGGHQVPQENESNPNLKPEVADTTTAGFVYRPSFIPRFSLSVDAYRITVNGYISTLAGNSQVIQSICIESNGTSPYCALTPRPFPISDHTTDNFALATISVPYNIASLDTYGADIEANYAATVLGRPLTLRGLASYQPHILYNNGLSGLVDMGDSATGQGGTQPSPSWKLTVIGNYSPIDNFKISVLEKWRNSMRWTGISTTPASASIPFAVTAPIFSNPPIPAIQYTDVTFTYTLKSSVGNTDLYLSIDNLFNQQPVPVAGTGGGSGVPGLFGGYAQGDDTVGRYFTLGLKFRH